MPQYALENVSKYYDGPAERIEILRHLNLNIETGESLAIVGASGSGKTTLLHLLGALDIPSEGTLNFEGTRLDTMSDQQKALFRSTKLGFVFQFHHLLPEFTTLENVAMQALIAGMPKKLALQKAHEALEQVGLATRHNHQVTTLSGGERQRAAIARAILLHPKVLLADEPTGNLDQRTGENITSMLVSLHSNLQMTLVIVTHNHDMAHMMGRCLELRSGELI